MEEWLLVTITFYGQLSTIFTFKPGNRSKGHRKHKSIKMYDNRQHEKIDSMSVQYTASLLAIHCLAGLSACYTLAGWTI